MILDKDELDCLTQDLYDSIFSDYESTFHKGQVATPQAKHDQTVFQAVYMSALLRLAATLAVDIQMAGPIFLASASESYDDADANAPKFG